MNALFELQRLRETLLSKGVATNTVETIVSNARHDIDTASQQHASNAMTSAVEAGVQKGSADFINELRLDTINFEIDTDSGNMDFSTPSRPMLPSLLKNAKPMKDGSGVYKIIPVGKPSKKPTISTNIHDAQKKIMAERVEAAQQAYKAITPAGSKTNFRVASSKQDANSRWVQPAKNADFSGDVKNINQELSSDLDDSIRDIIEGYIGMY